MFQSLTDPKAIEKLKQIKMLVVDVDGVMTDGSLRWEENRGWSRIYCIHDGYGIQLLMQNGIKVGVITAGSSKDVSERMSMLGIEDVFLGSADKLKDYEKLLKKYDLTDRQVAYIGDDLPDVPVLERSGFSVSVPDAVDPAKKRACYITHKAGGRGAVREVADGIRGAQSLGPYV